MSKTAKKQASKKKKKQLGIYLKISESNPLDMQVWMMLEECKNRGININVSATIKLLLHQQLQQVLNTGMVAMLPVPSTPLSNGNGNGHHPLSLPAPVDETEDPNDPLVQKLMAMSFEF